MADDIVTHEDDTLYERDDFDNGADPFAELMDLVPREAEAPSPHEPIMPAPAIEPEPRAEAANPDTISPESVHQEPEVTFDDDDVSDALMAEFNDATPEDEASIISNELYDVPDLSHDVADMPPVQEASALNEPIEADSLDSFLMAEFEAPAPAPEPIAPVETAIDLDFDNEIILDDLDLEPHNIQEAVLDDVPDVASDAFEDDIENALFAELSLDEPSAMDAVAEQPIQESAAVAEIDIDDFLSEELDDAIADYAALEPEQIIAKPKSPSTSQATIAATTLGGASNGWLDNKPINVDAPVIADELLATDFDDAITLDLPDDLELDLEDEIDDFALDLDDSSLNASIDFAPDAGPDPALEFADDNAVLDAQIKSLEESYDRPVVTAPHAEPMAVDKTSIIGVAAAGTVGLGLSRVFGASKANEPPVEAPRHEMDDVLSEMDLADAPLDEVDMADDIAIDLAMDDLDLMPEVNTIDLGGVPVTEAISVPHVDYDVQPEPVLSNDDFEQAISNSFSEMQDDDLLVHSDSSENIDLDLELTGLDFELDGATDVAYDQLLAEEGVQKDPFSVSQAVDQELDGLDTDDLDIGDIHFDDDDLAGLHEESGTTAYRSTAQTMPLSEMMGMAAAHRASKKTKNRKGLLIAACLGAVAIVAGAVGIGSQFFGSEGEADTAMIIPADTADVKMVPNEQSGLQVPNQDRAVFSESATTTNGGEQGSLIDGREPLVDSVKDTDRINPLDTEQSEAAKALEDAAQSVMTPRRVQTLVVKPDGTLAPSSEATIPPVVEEPSASDAERLLPSTVNEGVGADIAAAPQQVVRTVTVREGETPQVTANPTPRPVQPQAQVPAPPEVAPLVPSRPANQPVNIVNQNNNTQVAAVAPERPAVTAGTYFVQIASQPSEADARESGNSLSRRFASVIGGRGFVIQRAVIDGKGTFFRVRVPAGTRDEANALCARYKSAGGSCFISR